MSPPQAEDGASPSPRRAALVAAIFALAALIPALALRGFTVDDALISARYAAHLARGLGYRFNAAGPSTDGVTPLPWPFLLAPFAKGGPLAALAAAKWIGIAAWTAGAAAIGAAVHQAAGSRLRYGAIVLVAASAPLAAWSAAGMETGLVIGVAALATALRAFDHGRAGALLAGLAAAFRPELVPWAIVLAAAPGPSSPPIDPPSPDASAACDAAPPGSSRPAIDAPPRRLHAALVRAGLALLPFAIIVAIRVSTFGRPAPLAVLAKPSDPILGAKYALACFLLAGPVALIAPRFFLRASGFSRGLVLAVFAHFAAVALAGGDWMPLSRLVAPVLPTAALAAAHIAAASGPRLAALRLALALAGEIFQLVKIGPTAARVGEARLAVIEALRAPLADANVVASLDVGWVGAATEATIVDLAGLTDPAIAALSGGHTSKRIPANLLDARGVDTIVLLLKDGEPLTAPWTGAYFARIVELRVASIPALGEAFTPIAESRIPHLAYVILRRRAPLPAAE